jgi:hypothetical protein
MDHEKLEIAAKRIGRQYKSVYDFCIFPSPVTLWKGDWGAGSQSWRVWFAYKAESHPLRHPMHSATLIHAAIRFAIMRVIHTPFQIIR